MANAHSTNGRPGLGGADQLPMEERARSGPGVSVQNPYRANPDGDTVREAGDDVPIAAPDGEYAHIFFFVSTPHADGNRM